jgi:hypothetical protein
MWFGALVVYTRATKSLRRSAAYVFWIAIAILTAFWLISLRGDPPPDLRSLAITNAIFFVILACWTVWIDRNRPVAIAAG